jgi:hypothetical protein
MIGEIIIMNIAMEPNFEEDISSIITKAVNSKAEFMKFIKWYGYDNKSSEYRIIDFLVKDENDVKLWFAKFNGDLDTIEETTDKYKEHKLNKNSMDLSEFLARCAVSLKEAMEMLFQEECQEWLLTKFEGRLHNNSLTLEKVYQIFKSDSWYNSLSKIVRSDI